MRRSLDPDLMYVIQLPCVWTTLQLAQLVLQLMDLLYDTI